MPGEGLDRVIREFGGHQIAFRLGDLILIGSNPRNTRDMRREMPDAGVNEAVNQVERCRSKSCPSEAIAVLGVSPATVPSEQGMPAAYSLEPFASEEVEVGASERSVPYQITTYV